MRALPGVSEGLLFSLCARYLETQRPDGIVFDQKAIEIVHRLNLDCTALAKRNRIWPTQAAVAIRTELLDRAVQRFLQVHPEAVVVNLGAGLCTRYFRVDNGRVRWYELDLPALKRPWSHLFGESDRHRHLGCSVMDFAWMDILQPLRRSPFLFVAEGLLMYLTECEARQLVACLGAAFPCAELLAEAVSPVVVERHDRTEAASFRWGIDRGSHLEGWSGGVEFLQEWYYLDYYPQRWGWLRLLRHLPAVRRSMKIIHIRYR
ncbi:class I SAM-dependent methyltransferase [Gloeobacter morelensis]|uniref:Class I SAM-dependent methyltransferase n=1 Tax=Gloeobacter morelensis MG652769 TaxID=2781736 RepID=A0ABY3PM75_9CYAN|nr:class I SAM-dependent methyltransferase [Gloeobacter morelensis]UFP94775.1 class I SAM-dependent methyltransferase [Gloeobacter morelensis MG652769]